MCWLKARWLFATQAEYIPRQSRAVSFLNYFQKLVDHNLRLFLGLHIQTRSYLMALHLLIEYMKIKENFLKFQRLLPY